MLGDGGHNAAILMLSELFSLIIDASSDIGVIIVYLFLASESTEGGCSRVSRLRQMAVCPRP
jgi:hypothetical protein